jgi:hypothetical protein
MQSPETHLAKKSANLFDNTFDDSRSSSKSISQNRSDSQKSPMNHYNKLQVTTATTAIT